MANILTVNGGVPLVGDLEVRGAKNLVSKAMVAALLAEGPCRLRGVPGTLWSLIMRPPVASGLSNCEIW